MLSPSLTAGADNCQRIDFPAPAIYSQDMVDETITLDFLAAQQRKLLDEMRGMRTEMGALRDDLRVLSAIVMRQDGSLSAIVEQLRAMVQQQGRIADRVLALKKRP
jgi:hypothetical protein